jgi:sortase (surface protein transpeptidase)
MDSQVGAIKTVDEPLVAQLEQAPVAAIQSEDQILTLGTCYPPYYVGSAPHRFIVLAERVS